MKRLLIVIVVLLIILIGMFIYRNNTSKNYIDVNEIDKIEQFIKNIYLWPEITDEALPSFNIINDAPDKWLWAVVMQNLDKYELTYEEIQEKGKEIFGSDFLKKFPKEGTELISYCKADGKYITSNMELDTEDDLFYIKEIKKNKGGYEVEIIEYKVDYEEEIKKSKKEKLSEYDVYIKNLDEDIIATIKSNEGESKIVEIK